MTPEFKEQICGAYEDVRNDKSSTKWCCLKYNETGSLDCDSCGEEFDELRSKLGDDERVFAFLRVATGDELSKRAKFVFLTWTGQDVSAMKKAKMSTEKAFVKNVWSNFAVEMNFEDLKDFVEDTIIADVMKAGGANYGTGQ